MCELLGMSAARDTDVTELLREFYSHSDRHPNGWGLAIRHHGTMEITKEPVRASRSERLGTMLASGIRTDVLERLGLLQAIFRDMARGNKLNLILYDGELLYVHTNYVNSLYTLRRDGAAFFATVPLTEEPWEPVPFTTLCAYKNGRCYFQGDAHGAEYIDRPEDTHYLYTEFAAL